MSFDEGRKQVITVGDPKVVVDATISGRGGYLTTGHVEIHIMQGGTPKVATLKLDYRDAPSDQDASVQVIPALEAVVTQLSQALTRLKDRL
jgi:hypothetical protein